MGINHIVKQGEHLSLIARRHGFSDYKVIWNDPNNSTLKERRKNPNVLYPGDKLFIPVKEEKEVTGATEQRHRFQLHRSLLKLRLVLKDHNFNPLAKTKCVLHVDGNQFELTSDAEGLVEHAIPQTATQARLDVDDPRSSIDLRVPIQIGHLDPVDTMSGQKARLNNLGYYAGPQGRPDEEGLLRSAIEEFQCDQHLTVTGSCDTLTQAALLREHGI